MISTKTITTPTKNKSNESVTIQQTTPTTTTTTPQFKLIDLSVSNCSSESEVYKSNNVLSDDTYRIWQTKDKTDKSFIELQFPTPSLIKKIEITNAGSAFIEVLVGLVTWEPSEFQVLVPLSNFMSFSESTNRSNRNRMKSFDINKFTPQTVPRKWERVRIICTQPWGDDNIGVSLVKIYGPPIKSSSTSSTGNTSKLSTPQLLDDSNNISLTDTSGTNLLDTSVESDPNVDFKSDKTQVLNFLPTELKRLNSSNLRKSATVILSNPLPGQVLVINKSKSKPPASAITTSTIPVNNENPEVETEEEEEEKKIEIKKKLDKQQKQSSSSQQQQQSSQNSSQKPKLTEPSLDDEEENEIDDNKMKDVIIGNKNNNNNNKNNNKFEKSPKPSQQHKEQSNTNDGETDEECDSLQVIATPKQQKKLTSFGNLLKGVVLVIGGIVNPEKGELRSKAMEMGADYKPDWCREATHLITPFKNTPKFKTAEKAGGSIVKPKWIEDCYKSKSRLPIRNYIFGNDDSDDQDESDNQSNNKPLSLSKKNSNKSISTSTSSKKRKKSGAPGSDDSDDDSHIPNVYDYNDGFIDNSFSSSEAEDKDPDEIEFQPENVNDLLKDGIEYLKRTYGHVPDRDIRHITQNSHHHKKQKNNENQRHERDDKYKSSTTYKPNKYYDEDYNGSQHSSNSGSKNNNNNKQNQNQNSGDEEQPSKIKYTPKQPKVEDTFDEDLLFGNTQDTLEMTPVQVKEEIERIVNSNQSPKTANGSSSSNSTTPQLNSKSSPPSTPKSNSTILPKNSPQDFKGKEYILNPLPSFFEGFEFYLSIKDGAIRKNIIRLITAYKGNISNVPTVNTKFIITDKTVWDRLFDITKQKFPNVLFLNPSFIMQSHNYQKLSPVEKHLISK